MKTLKRWFWLPALAFVLALVSGCLNLKPAEDPTRYHILSALATDTNAAQFTNTSLRVGLRPVVLPSYLRENRIAIREGEHQIQYQEWSHWAEALEAGAVRVLGANLAQLLRSDEIRSGNWSSGDVQFEVETRIARFEPDAQGLVTLDVAWRVIEPGNRQVLRSAQGRFQKQGGSNDSIGAVAAMSATLAQFSEALAAVLCEMSENDGEHGAAFENPQK